MPLSAMLHSAATTLDATITLVAHVFHEHYTPELRSKVERSLPKERATIRWYAAPTERVAQYPALSYVTRPSYYYFLAPDALGPEIQQVIYLDCDVIVRRSLAHLAAMPMNGKAVLGVPDPWAPFAESPYGIGMWRELGIPPGTSNYNSGVLLLDLQRWRELGLQDRVFAFLDTHADRILMQDQEAINAVLWREFGRLDARWNQVPEFFDADAPGLVEYDALQLEAICTDPWCVHYAVPSKPWHGGNRHPWRSLFFEHLNGTQWAGWKPPRMDLWRYRLRPRLGQVKRRLRKALVRT